MTTITFTATHTTAIMVFSMGIILAAAVFDNIILQTLGALCFGLTGYAIGRRRHDMGGEEG